MTYLNQAVSRFAYPTVLVFAVGGHLAMSAGGLPAPASIYVPLVAAALTVAGLEHIHPARAAWKPTRDDVVNDSVFMLAVQMILPKTIALLFLLGVTHAAPGFATGAAGLWPRWWPVTLQVLLMLLVADFLRYWLHRAAHRFSPLWALHAVHHSPRRLYWLNVGRFHPLEKLLQLCLDALPFVLLDVPAPVLGLYFVCYAVNGFFQHCNIDVRLGPLNYLVSGPELHRWHHARDPRIACCNFGNNLIVWDLLFGTRYLPEGRQVAEIGIRDHHYPADFTGQITAPFRGGAVAHAVTPAAASHGLAHQDKGS